MKRVDQYIPLLITTQMIALSPHLSRLPLWIILWCLVFWGYTVLGVKNTWPLPPKLLRQVLTVCGFCGILITYGPVLNRDASVGLLCIMSGLKPLETATHRDRMIIIFMTYFLIISNLFYSNTLLVMLYMFLSVLTTTTVLIHINHPRGHLRLQVRQAARIMLQALPLMIILFFLFPRIQGNLWGLQRTASGKSGFSDKLSPGDIANLVQSNEIAFRVEFKDIMPPPEQLYWRGIVYRYFNGKSWIQEPRKMNRREALEGEA
ncbi:DUF3488 domain-containing protein, partial [candidate division CSSED10-310 bacterium]